MMKQLNDFIFFSWGKTITKNKSYRTTVDRKVDILKNISYILEIATYI